MEEEVKKIKCVLKERAMLGLLDRLEDTEPSRPEYRSMFETLAYYIYDIETINSMQELLTAAGKCNFSYSGIFSVEEFLEIFFKCKL